jgi:hypothetical protein
MRLSDWSSQANTSRGIQGAAKQAAPEEGAARHSMYQPYRTTLHCLSWIMAGERTTPP